MLCLVEFFKRYYMENAIARLESHPGLEKGGEPDSVFIDSTSKFGFRFRTQNKICCKCFLDEGFHYCFGHQLRNKKV